MELTYSNRVFFEPVSHTYTLDDDKLLMGVTELMAKHNLGADYSGIPEARLKQAAAEGTTIHQEIEAYDSGEAVFASELIDEYKQMCSEYGLKSVASEYPVSDYELIASAIDKVYEGKKGHAILVDIKTTLELHKRPLQWQLGIYKYLFKRQNPDIPVDGCFCLWIDKKKKSIKGLIPIEPVSEAEVEALLDAERQGLIYIDENAVKDASLALPEDELAAYVNNAVTIAELKAKIKEIEAAMADAGDKLLTYMEANNLDEMSAPGGVFKRKASYSQTRVDSAKLKKDFPAVWQKVAKETAVKGSVSFKPNE